VKAPITAAILSALLSACVTPTPAKVAAPTSSLTHCTPQKMVFYFGSWETALNELAQKEITMVQSKLAGCSIDSVQIVGMAGAPGDVEANMDVSRKRAETVADALAAGGWPRDRIAIEVRGEEGSTTADGLIKPMRRRAEVSVAASAPQ
jgi:outer membrane protein OmpA-like peptidoglycan-associated protein